MELTHVKWSMDPDLMYRGRNGFGYSCGVTIALYEGKGAVLSPINTKGITDANFFPVPEQYRRAVALAICPELDPEKSSNS